MKRKVLTGIVAVMLVSFVGNLAEGIDHVDTVFGWPDGHQLRLIDFFKSALK